MDLQQALESLAVAVYELGGSRIKVTLDQKVLDVMWRPEQLTANPPLVDPKTTSGVVELEAFSSSLS